MEMREDTCPVHGSYYATVCPGCWEELTGDVSEPLGDDFDEGGEG